MSLPLELEEAFADVHKRITANHKGIRRSLSRLRTLVVGHYNDVNKFARGLEARVDKGERQAAEHGATIADLARRVEKLEHRGNPPPTELMRYGG